MQFTPMRFAVGFGKVEVVNFYVETEKEEIWNRASSGTKKNEKGITPLHVAAKFGENNIVRLLLEKVTNKIPKDGVGRTPLHYSAWNGQVEASKILINSVIENNKNLVNLHSYKEDNFSTPLDYAAKFGHEDIVKLLLEQICEDEIQKKKIECKVEQNWLLNYSFTIHSRLSKNLIKS